MINGKRVRRAKPVNGSESSVPVGVFRFIVLVRLLATCAGVSALPEPVVLECRSVDVLRQIVIIIGSEYHVKSFYKQISLAVFNRRNEGVPFAVLLSEYYFLSYTGLNLFVKMRVGESQHEPVGP